MGEGDRGGYWATWIGSIAGFVAGCFLGGWIGEATVPEGAGLDGIFNFLVGLTIGAWLGSVLGAWLVLVVTKRPFATNTATIFFFLSPIVVGVSIVIAGAISNGEVEWPFPVAIIVGGIILNGYIARRLAVREAASPFGSPPDPTA